MKRTLLTCITLFAIGAAPACKSDGKAASAGSGGSSSEGASSGSGGKAAPNGEGGAADGSSGKASTGKGGSASSGTTGSGAGQDGTDVGGSGSEAGESGSAARGGSDNGGTSGSGPARGGSGGDTSFTPVSCADVGVVTCGRLEQCAPFLLDAFYRDRDGCEALLADGCSMQAEAGAELDFQTCGAALASCGSFVEARGVPAWCWKARGALKLGGACTNDLDCSEGLCERKKGDATGRCAVPAGVGESCDSPRRCAVGLRCRPSDSKCVSPLQDGATCSSPFDCQAGSTCTSDLVCAPTVVGDACAEGIVPCTTGQTCLLDVCSAITWADEENSCIRGNVECQGAERCVIEQSSNLERTGECRTSLGVGESCDATSPCTEPLTCRSGVCQP